MKLINKPITTKIVILLLALAMTSTLASAATAKKVGPPPLVTVITVAEEDVSSRTEYVGHVEAVQTVDLPARVSGVLEQLHFMEGSDVRSGDLLYVIEPAPYQVKVAVNQARVAKAQVVLGFTSLRNRTGIYPGVGSYQRTYRGNCFDKRESVWPNIGSSGTNCSARSDSRPLFPQ